MKQMLFGAKIEVVHYKQCLRLTELATVVYALLQIVIPRVISVVEFGDKLPAEASSLQMVLVQEAKDYPRSANNHKQCIGQP
jgi:hypothetical protein